MRRSVILMLVLLTSVSLLALMPQPVGAVGKYCFAYWRELGERENGGCIYDGGRNRVTVWVFDEQGNPKPNVAILATWPAYMASTDSNGLASFTIDENWGELYIMCQDTAGSLSETSHLMTGQRQPCYGHYSYEVGFLYKSDSNNPGTFDTSVNCTINGRNSNETDAPFTKSLAYYSTDCTNRTSDSYRLGSWQGGNSFFGQTFVATGDRIVAVQAQATRGGTDPVYWYCQILEGGPTGSPVSPVKQTPIHNTRLWLVPFGVNECPVVPGRTYFLKIWRPEGLNVYQVERNNYANGQYYEGTTPYPGIDLQGLVLCMNYGSTQLGTIAGIVKNDSGQPVNDAVVTAQPGNYTRTSASDGTFTFANLPAGTYTVSADRPGHCPVSIPNVVVTTGRTTNVTLTMNRPVNLIQNYTFANGLNNWTVVSNFGLHSDGQWAVPAHTAPNYAGGITSWVNQAGTAYQVVTGLTAGKEYRLSSFIYTDCWQGANRQYEYPENCKCWVAVDPTGGTNWQAATVQWSFAAWSHVRWSFLSKTFTATGPQATVFLRYVIQNPHEWNKACFDDVYLETCEGGIVNPISIGEALKKPNNTLVSLADKPVIAGTEQIGGGFYIEELDQSAGVLVVSETPAWVSNRVDVVGTMGLNTHGERCVNAQTVTPLAPWEEMPERLFLTQVNLGGTALNEYTPGVYQGIGLYNVGKLVSCFGRVTARGTNFFYIDDGSNLKDGSGYIGVRVDTTGLTNPQENYAVVTGVSTIRKINNNPVRVIRPRTQLDIVGF